MFLLQLLLRPTSPSIQGSGHQVISTQQVQRMLRAREDRKQMVVRPAKQNRAAAFASAMNAFTHTTPHYNRDTLRRRHALTDVWVRSSDMIDVGTYFAFDFYPQI